MNEVKFYEIMFFCVAGLAGFATHKKQYGYAVYLVLYALFVGALAALKA